MKGSHEQSNGEMERDRERERKHTPGILLWDYGSPQNRIMRVHIGPAPHPEDMSEPDHNPVSQVRPPRGTCPVWSRLSSRQLASRGEGGGGQIEAP